MVFDHRFRELGCDASRRRVERRSDRRCRLDHHRSRRLGFGGCNGSTYSALHRAHSEGQAPLRLAVKGDRDPGYGSTSKMIAEAALCLAREAPEQGGFWTPGALMGDALVRRLTEHAGLTFELEAASGAAA